MKKFAQGHLAAKHKSWDFNLGTPASKAGAVPSKEHCLLSPASCSSLALIGERGIRCFTLDALKQCFSQLWGSDTPVRIW